MARNIFWGLQIFSRKMLRNFPRKFRAFILWVRKNPAKFPPNFPRNFPPKNQKNSPTSFCGGARRNIWQQQGLHKKLCLTRKECKVIFLLGLASVVIFGPLWPKEANVGTCAARQQQATRFLEEAPDFRGSVAKEGLGYDRPNHCASFSLSLGIGNGVGRQGRGYQPPDRRCGPDTEIQYRPREPHGLAKTRRILSKFWEADTEFQYRHHIVDTDTDCGRQFCVAEAIAETPIVCLSFEDHLLHVDGPCVLSLIWIRAAPPLRGSRSMTALTQLSC